MDCNTSSDIAERASGHDKESQLTSAGGSSDTCAHKQRAKIIESKKEKKELFIKNTYENIQHDQVCIHKHSDHPIESRVQRIHHLHKFMENKAQHVLAETERASGRAKESYLRCAHKQQSQSIESEEERIQHFHENINREMQQDPAVAVVARIPKQSDHFQPVIPATR